MVAAPKKARACLFDMDGLLINTEDMYTISISQVLTAHGHPPLEWNVKVKLQGLPGPAASAKVLEHYPMPYTPEELYQKTSDIQLTLWPTTKFMPGALELLTYLSENNIPIALATSSQKDKFVMKTSHLQHGFEKFGKHLVTGDDPRIPPGRGKPFPDIWQIALRGLNDERLAKGLDEVKIDECLVFEDGIPGVQAGSAAGAHVVWVPDVRAIEAADKQLLDSVIGKEGEQNTVLKSLADFKPADYGL